MAAGMGKQSNTAQPCRMIPSSAKNINTHLVQDSWRNCLQKHSNQQLTQFFLKGISEGFRGGYGTQATSPKSSKRIYRMRYSTPM